MICSKCGRDNAQGAAFCAGCGAPLATSSFQQPMYGQPMMMGMQVPGKGLGIASMVLGIVSLVLFCIWYISIPCAIIGAALGGVSKSKSAGAPNGVATAGIVCSCVALGLAIFFIILVAAGAAQLDMMF